MYDPILSFPAQGDLDAQHAMAHQCSIEADIALESALHAARIASDQVAMWNSRIFAIQQLAKAFSIRLTDPYALTASPEDK